MNVSNLSDAELETRLAAACRREASSQGFKLRKARRSQSVYRVITKNGESMEASLLDIHDALTTLRTANRSLH